MVTATPTGPSVTPTPTPTPRPTPTPQPGGGGTGDWQTIDVANLSLTVPANWSVANRDASFVQVRDPATKSLEIAESGSFEQARTVEQFQQDLVAKLTRDRADVTTTTAAEAWVNGLPGGLFFVLQSTATPETGEALTVYDVYYIAVQRSNYFMWRFVVVAARWDEFKPTYLMLPQPTWKLYQAGE
ncbi:MAG: hypothetical protein ACXWZ2_09325 [Mycobacterium sp.]